MPAKWKLTDAMTDRKIKLPPHTYWRHTTTGLWWSSDTAKHAGCAFKVYKMVGRKLIWYKDADEYGDFIGKKHKSAKGTKLTLQNEEEDDDPFGSRVR